MLFSIGSLGLRLRYIYDFRLWESHLKQLRYQIPYPITDFFFNNYRYYTEHFAYDKNNDTHTCPQGRVLRSNRSRYKGRNYYFKQYKTKSARAVRRGNPAPPPDRTERFYSEAGSRNI